MKNHFTKPTFCGLLLLMIFINSCIKAEDIKKSDSTPDQEIYFRWTEDLSHSEPSAQWCNESAAAYTSFSHEELPLNPVKSQYYGPLPPGQLILTSTHTGSALNYSFTLSAPKDGYKRFYSLRMKYYSSTLNRCVDAWQEVKALSYQDVPLSENQ